MTHKKAQPPTNVAASVKARLLKHARQEGGDFNAVVVRYVLERLLYRLANSAHSNEFVLKGALLFVIWSGRPHRATKDVDLLSYGTPDLQRLESVFRDVCAQVVPEDGVEFDSSTVAAEVIREDTLYDGIRLRFIARLGSGRVPVQVDVGFGDATTPKAQLMDLPVLLDHPAPRIRVYAQETTLAEKLHAMVDLGLGNSRMKDYYDCWYLSEFHEFSGSTLSAAIEATFEKRGTSLPNRLPVGLTSQFAEDESKLAQRRGFLRRARLATDAPPFEEVVDRLKVFLNPVLQAGHSGKPFEQRWPIGGAQS